jgi:hypothetical protein
VRPSDSRAFSGRDRLLWAAVLAAPVLALVVASGCLRRHSEDNRVDFSERVVAINDYDLFDVGVADANDDGLLDIYTANHISRQSLLIGDGRGNFRDECSEWGLSHQPEFPGLEDSPAGPDPSGQGIFIYWCRRRLIVRAAFGNDAAGVSGRLVLDSTVEIETETNWRCRLRRLSLAHDRTRTEVDFELPAGSPDGLLIVKPELIAVPLTFSFDESVPRDRLFVGAGKRHPRAHTFRLCLKDRHGMAWADWNGDGRTDLFIVQGGVSGRTADFPHIYPYELFSGTGAGLTDVTPRMDFKKCGARPRQVAWVDVDGDSLLDLFIYGAWSRNQLFKQMPGGRFVDVTDTSGLLETQNGLSSWFDADGDGDQDLFIAGRDSFTLYLNDRGHFRETILGPAPSVGGGVEPEYRQFGRPAVADFDGDGDFDIYVASARGSAVLINEGGRFALRHPAALGLPSRAVTANWVDADNDSLPDLHTVPDGLFRQAAGHRFEKTGILGCDQGDAVVAARCNWFDADNDGDRDVLVSVLDRAGEAARIWSTRFFANNGTKNHWLEIQVSGPSGNRNGVGARVVVELSDGRRLVQQVGSSEGADYSQGHYRLYFGLGKDRNPRAVIVSWPDGASERIEKPGCDRLLICGGGRNPSMLGSLRQGECPPPRSESDSSRKFP